MDVKAEYYMDPDTGQRYVMTKTGGTTVSDGSDAGAVVVKDAIVIWAGTSDTNAPTLDYNAIGVNQGGIYTGDVYLYDTATDTWNPMTGITTITLFGG